MVSLTAANAPASSTAAASSSTVSSTAANNAPKEADAPKVVKGIRKKYIKKTTSISTFPSISAVEVQRMRCIYGRTGESFRFANPGTEQDSLGPNLLRNFDDVIVIHPGSRNLRIGRASDALPVEVPHAIFRKSYSVSSAQVNTTPQQQQQETESVLESGSVVSSTDIPAERAHSRAPTAQSGDLNTPRSVTPSEPGASSAHQQVRMVNGRPLTDMEEELRARMRHHKVRATPQATQLCNNWNVASTPDIIPDHNDPYKIEWVDVTKIKHMTGRKALHIPHLSPANSPPPHESEYQLFYPILNGRFNDRDYTSLEAVLTDLEKIWMSAIQDELRMTRQQLRECVAVLVVPDKFIQMEVEALVSLILRQLGFKSVVPIQESVCGTFVLSTSMSLVVDMGAQKTSISCVEDGIVLDNTRIVLPYGGDDATSFLNGLLHNIGFPYKEVDIWRRVRDWQLVQELKEKYGTIDDSGLGLTILEFFVRAPNAKTRKFKMKIYDEMILTAMSMFYPGLLNIESKLKYKKGRKTWWDQWRELRRKAHESGLHHRPQTSPQKQPAQPTGALDSVTKAGSTTVDSMDVDDAAVSVDIETKDGDNETLDDDLEIAETEGGADDDKNSDHGASNNVLSLDDAIFESITRFYKANETSHDVADRVSKLLSSMLLVGGGCLFAHFPVLLLDRLNLKLYNWWISHPVLLRHVDYQGLLKIPMLQIAQYPREIQPKYVVWKGAAVFGKLDCAREMVVGREEFEKAGDKCFSKWVFSWDEGEK